MSLAVLNKKDKKKSLSGKKKCKKLKKNVLTLPDKLRIKKPEVDENNISSLASMLESLLPCFKSPENSANQNNQNKSETGHEEELLSKNKLKRNQLLLGINVVSKAVNNDTVECVIFADDISPKLLITHLIVLCSLKNIPYVYMPNFRELTRKAFGFPCIVLGFKKNSTNFFPVIELICASVKNEKYDQKSISDSDLMKLEDNTSDSNNEDKTEQNENTFTYLCRDIQTKKRVFIPDSCNVNHKTINENEDVISFGSGNEESDGVEKFKNADMSEDIRYNVNSLELKKKKKRKHWKNSNPKTDVSAAYSAAKVVKIGADPVREKKNSLKLKKNKVVKT